MAKQSAEKVLDRIMNYPYKEKGCSYICGPHLEPCVMVRAHDGDCECKTCHPDEAAESQPSEHLTENPDWINY